MGEFWAKSGEALFSAPGNHGDYLAFLRESGVDFERGAVLDAGCNRAWFAHFAGDYRGFDCSDAAVSEARGYWAARKGWREEEASERIRRGTVETIPFGDGAFDLVFAKDVLEHSRDLVGALRELDRVMKKGGALFLSTPDLQTWAWHDPTHVRPYSRRSHRAIAEIQKWEIVAEKYESVCPGTQKVARWFGNRSPAALDLAARLWFWNRNVLTVYRKR